MYQHFNNKIMAHINILLLSSFPQSTICGHIVLFCSTREEHEWHINCHCQSTSRWFVTTCVEVNVIRRI